MLSIFSFVLPIFMLLGAFKKSRKRNKHAQQLADESSRTFSHSDLVTLQCAVLCRCLPVEFPAKFQGNMDVQPPSRFKFFHFYAVFGNKICKVIGRRKTLLELEPLENPRSAIDCLYIPSTI